MTLTLIGLASLTGAALVLALIIELAYRFNRARTHKKLTAVAEAPEEGMNFLGGYPDNRFTPEDLDALMKYMRSCPMPVKPIHGQAMPQFGEMTRVSMEKAVEQLGTEFQGDINELLSEVSRRTQGEDAPSVHDVAALDRQTLAELNKGAAVDRSSFQVVRLSEAEQIFNNMVEDELRNILHDDLDYYDEPCHSERTVAMAHNRSVPKFTAYAQDKQFVSKVGGQTARFAPVIIEKLPAEPQDPNVRLAEIAARKKASEDRKLMVEEITAAVRERISWTIEVSVQKALRTVLAKELTELATLAKSDAKKELEDEAFLKKVEAEALEEAAQAKPVKKPKKKPVKRKF